MPNVSSDVLWDVAVAQCCQEPVHILGYIQPFGGLLATDENLELITHGSANLAGLLGLSAIQGDGASLLGQDLQTLLPEQLVHDLRNACGLPWIQAQRERVGTYDIQGRSFDISVHFNGHRMLIELEPLPTVLEHPAALAARMKALLQNVSNSEMLIRAVTEELRNATGFDRVMAYRFLQDGSGEVVAEARSTDMASLLGLRFPATDIPELARLLFRKTSLRVIPHIDAAPVPLLAWNPEEDPLDLSLAQVRGASTGHTQRYLSNMGVQGSMTLAIIVEGQLWGLFALHHSQPKLLSPEFRTTLELCGTLLSMHLQQTITAEHFYARKQAATVLAQTFAQAEPSPTTSDKREQVLNQSWEMLVVEAQPQLCKLLNADGLAFVVDQKVLASHGQVPPERSILALIDHGPLNEQVQSETGVVAVGSFEALSESSPEVAIATDWGDSAGGGFFSVKYYENHYFSFFRNELSSEVRWAGNPHQQDVVPTDDTEFPFSPERSFDMYKEIVGGQCRPWSRDDLAIILEVKSELQNQVGLFLQQQQNLLIAELKHRVKNILALIRSVARQTSRSKLSVAEYTDVLEQRIAALGLAHDLISHTGTEWPSLREIFAIELRPYLANESERHQQAQLLGPNVKLSSLFVPTFVLVIHELVSNAVKYGALSVPEGRVEVSWHPVNGGASLHWRESSGPRVQPPQERGFGCELIERAIPYEFDGEVTLRFPATGVEADFWIPQDLLEWISPAQTPRRQEPARQLAQAVPPPGSKGRVLIVEDSMLIAIELENTLKALGFDPVDSAPKVSRALKLLNRERYRVCLLDIDLKHETSFALAYKLQKEQIPFLFTTGYDSKYSIPDDLRSVVLLKKPLNPKKLQYNLDELLRTSAQII